MSLGISRQTRRLSPEAFLSRLFRGSGSTEVPSFSENCRGYPEGGDAPYGVPAGGGSFGTRVPGDVVTHRCRSPELEGSTISVLGRIASLFILAH